MRAGVVPQSVQYSRLSTNTFVNARVHKQTNFVLVSCLEPEDEAQDFRTHLTERTQLTLITGCEKLPLRFSPVYWIHTNGAGEANVLDDGFGLASAQRQEVDGSTPAVRVKEKPGGRVHGNALWYRI